MTPEELIGRSLLDGEYVLQEILGRGGMATVYRAYCRSLDTDVAVKVLAPRLAQDPGFRERFHDEARSLAPMHHPNLIEVHRYGEEGDLVFIAMRLVAGGTLKQLAQAMPGPLDIVTTARVIGQVADALQLAHEENLIHLDIKPANILLGRHDWPLWPLLADFGITRAAKYEQTERGGERLAGTPLYMSPEQCVGGPIDGRSDEYSLAVTTFELLTGRVPFMAETTEMLLQRHIVEPPPRVRSVNPAVPGPVEEVVLRGLAKSPDDRYPTVREFGQALSAAAEKARGVSLETKAALSALAPNLIAAVALVLIGPLLLTVLPEGAMVGQRIPLIWPFQFALSLMLAGLLLGVRWHVIGLLTRAANGVLDAAIQAGGLGPPRHEANASPKPAGVNLPVKAWRNAVVASVEGIVNLGYLIVLYRLVAISVLTILASLVPGAIYQAAVVAVGLVLAVGAVAIVVAIYRASGPSVAVILLAVGWALVNALPAADFVAVGGAGVVEPARVLVGAVLLVAVLALRRSTRPVVARGATAVLSPLLLVAQPGASSEQTADGQRHLGRLAEGILDYGYLLLGYALLQGPLVATLRQPLGGLPAAIVVSGVAVLVWAFLAVRLRWIAGAPGAALGVVLGAPLLTSLPLFQPQALSTAWPATVASWVVAAAVILLLAMVRGQVQTVGQRALGPLLDRGLAGTRAAPTEDQADRRARALGELAGALVDAALLVVGYWVVGLPAVEALGQASGRQDLGSIVLAGVVLAALGLLAGPLRRALIAVDETGGSTWTRRFAAAPGLAVALAALFVGGCAAVPAALAAPGAAGGLALVPVRAPVVLVDWQHYVPWTPTQDQAAYAVSLSCSDGRQLGVFQEAFRPAPGAPMPSGNVGTLGLTGASCSDWPSTYFTLRKNAGLPAQSSVSWDAVDVRAALQPDGSADVVETHRVLFTNGSYANLVWPEAAGESQGKLSNIRVAEGGLAYSDRPAGTAPYYVVDSSNGQSNVSWSFPSVASPAVRTYTIHYRLDGIIQNVEGGQQFTRQVVLPNRVGPVWQMTVEVTLPNLPAGTPQLTSSGVDTRKGMIDPRTAWFAAENVPSGDGLNITVRVPGGFGPAVPVSPPTPTRTPQSSPTRTPTTVAAVLAPTVQTSPSDTPTEGAAPAATDTETPLPSPSAQPTEAPTEAPTEDQRPTGTVTPVPTQTFTPTITSTPSITNTPSITSTPTDTGTVTATITATPSYTPTPSVTPTLSVTPTPSVTPTQSPSRTPTLTFTASPTKTSTPTNSPVPTNTPLPTLTPTFTPVPRAISLNPTSGGYSTTITVNGQGFPSGSITIYFNGTTETTSPSPCSAGASGTFKCSFPAPCYSSTGSYAVVANSNQQKASATAYFNYNGVCIP